MNGSIKNIQRSTVYYLRIFALLYFFSGCVKIPMSDPEKMTFEISKFSVLPEEVNECSGMISDSNQILIINDGGGGPFLYQLNNEGNQTLQKIEINGAQNVDWETIVQTNNEIIIGDFGNNVGKREDLKIYHINNSTYKLIKTVEFRYPDQLNFEDVNHNFDCEAMVVMDDSYFLFTKNRGNSNSNIYKSALYTSSFEFQDSISVPGQVTDACYDEKSNSIILVCYNYSLSGFKNYLVIVKPMKNGKFKNVKVFDIEYPEQIEAISNFKENEFLIGSEKGFFNGGNLYKVTLSGL